MNKTARNKNNTTGGSKAAQIIIYVLMCLICFLTLYPLYYVFILSISEPQAAATMRVYILPKGLFIQSYATLLRNKDLWRSLAYTILYVISGTILTLFTSATFGYVLSSPKLVGRRILTIFLLIPIYFSGGMIPSFLLITKLNIYNTVWALILTSSFNIFYIFLARTYFMSVPEALRESARIDGANNYRIFLKIYMPLATPVLGVIAIYTVVNIWNSWFNSMVYQPNAAIQPLQMYLRRVLIEQTVDLTKVSMQEAEVMARLKMSNSQLKYAMIIITTLPIVSVYPFFQKYFVKGIMIGSVKG